MRKGALVGRHGGIPRDVSIRSICVAAKIRDKQLLKTLQPALLCSILCFSRSPSRVVRLQSSVVPQEFIREGGLKENMFAILEEDLKPLS
jgi:hypothetical protein